MVSSAGSSHPLLDRDRIDEPVRDFLDRIGRVFRVFDRQDSGNVSYGVEVGADRFFVKTSGDPLADAFLDHESRVALLRTATELAGDLRHPTLPVLHRVVESLAGPALVSAWHDGELIGVRQQERDDPLSSFQRFRALPAERIAAALDDLIDLHDRLAELGWVACDLYDGSLIYDFASGRLTIIDLDSYHRGPLINPVGRMFGSTRFMAPEEFERGATIDQRTTVYTLGRFVAVFLSDGTLDRAPFRGSPALHDVMVGACREDPAERFHSVSELAAAWRAAR